MCGIAGIFGTSRVSPAVLSAIAETMRLRGPDDVGFFERDGIALVHTRLSIRDLSERGRCPMPNEDGSVQVVFNGEIYNWRELRDELQRFGHSFRSSCDTEVLVRGYEQWREKLFERLRGMFAIGIWDAREERLLLARDRLGEKPLFYAERNGCLVFASTISAILAAAPQKPEINKEALACYFAHSFIPASHTAYEGIEVFPPAHYGIVGKSGALRVQRYWGFPDLPPRRVGLRCAEIELEQILCDCVERCLDADVPVGVFLSGGVDSSVVAAMAAQRQSNLRSFSIGFEERESDELPYARAVATAIGLNHTESILRVNDVIDLLPELVAAYDQPFGDASAVPTYAVSRLARKHVKVCLSGDGGDESFAGYWRAQSIVYASRYARFVPRDIRSWLTDHRLPFLGGTAERVVALNKLSVSTVHGSYTNSQSWYDRLPEIAGPKLTESLRHQCIRCRVGTAREFNRASVLQRALHDDFQVQLPDAYLRKVDVASMAASLEVRAPLLDVELLEFAWRLPDNAKLHWGQRKYLLKRLAAKLVPKEVIYRRKMGFGMPLTQWFRGELAAYLGELMRDSYAVSHGWLNRETITRELKQHQSGVRDNHTRLWLVLWFELWLRSVCYGEKTEQIAGEPCEPCTC